MLEGGSEVTMRQSSIVLLVATVGLAACRGDRVPNGAWGGDHVVLTVTDSGGAVEMDCAHGTLDQPLRLDDRGRFYVAGTFIPEHGGPIRADEAAQQRPARYQGRIDHQEIEFTITVEG